ncbi:MAG: YHS domain-containing protein [Deltaproteobacteria bacterium]|nr:YHS domain-containing protein [Deltaproteobacteria bacterium]
MTPLRLFIIGILLFILYRLLVGPKKKRMGGKKKGGVSSGGAIQDVLVEDPVCHTYIPKGQAVQLHHDKKKYYFCSDKCCETFLKQKGDKE